MLSYYLFTSFFYSPKQTNKVNAYVRKIIPLKWDVSPEWDLGRMAYFTL